MSNLRVIVKNSSPPPTVGRQITNSLPTGHQQVTDSQLEEKYLAETYDKTHQEKKKTKSFQKLSQSVEVSCSSLLPT